MAYFPEVADRITYEGRSSKNPLAFKHYEANQKVGDKTMREHLRFAVAYWHTFKGTGQDPFGAPTMIHPWEKGENPMDDAKTTLDAAFEFFTKLGVDYWCFHDRDIAPEGATFSESVKNLDEIVDLAAQRQKETGVKLLWGTACLFVNPRFQAGASTNPDPHVFAYAAAQVKAALDATARLGGQGYVFWGGRVS